MPKKSKIKDSTAAQRGRNRSSRIAASGLSHLKVIMHKDDADKIRSYAMKLYEKKGYSLNKT